VTTPDQVTVFYGSKPQIANPTTLSGNMGLGGNGADPVTVSNPYAYHPGDLLVLLQPSSGLNCTLIEATAITNTNTVAHLDAGTSYQVLNPARSEVARFNQPGGAGVVYGGVGSGNVTRVFNLGNLFEPAGNPNRPVNNTYAIGANNTLTITAAFVDKTAPASPLTTAVADNIVQLRAEYGVDDGVAGVGSGVVPITNGGANIAGDGLIDRWVPPATFNALAPAPLFAPPWPSVLAVRLAVVARSALPEKPSGRDGTKCDTTTDGTEATPGPDMRPKWASGLIDVSASGDPNPASMTYWKCYRYRVFETTVPLRNWIWKSS
jgi:type IV pilus assembly protein PilW